MSISDCALRMSSYSNVRVKCDGRPVSCI